MNAMCRVSLVVVIFLQVVTAIPARGKFPWTMVLCKFRDNPNEPKPADWFRRWLNDTTNDGSISRYFDEVSNGAYSIKDSNVVGWYTLPYSRRDVVYLARSDSHLEEFKELQMKVFYKTKEICINEAKRNGAFLHPSPRTISVINDEAVAVFCKKNGVLLSPKFFLSSALTHEMTHSFNIGHSYSDQKVKIFPFSSVGEYGDRYDLMSTANAYMYPSIYGLNGPGLNGAHLDYLGWLPASRMYYFGKGGQKHVLRLSSLSVAHANSSDYLLILIPYNVDNPQDVYTVELRTPSSMDKGIHKPALIIHKIHKENGYTFSYLVTHKGKSPNLQVGKSWVEYLGSKPGGAKPGFIRVEFLGYYPEYQIADLEITSNFDPTSCLADEVPRGIVSDDPVCVSKDAKHQIHTSTLRHHNRTDENGACLSGFIRRQALTDDLICVHPSEQQSVRAQNHRWYRRQKFFQNLQTYGLNACKDGYVWRQIDEYDYVCVTEASRDDVKRQNIHHNDVRRKRHQVKSRGCGFGLVRRAAFEGDDVCVTKRELAKVQEDNAAMKKRLRYYGFFNGIDNVRNTE